MGNCCTPEHEILGLVVFDPSTKDCARVDIPHSDPRVLRHQRLPVPDNWSTLHVFCDDPQAADRRYSIYNDATARPRPQEYIAEINFGQLRHPRVSTGQALYVGRIPN